MTKKVAFICFEDFQLLDLTGPLQVFESAWRNGQAFYETQVMSEQGGLVKSSAGLAVETQKLGSLSGYDSMVIVGGQGTYQACNNHALIAYVKEAATLVRRIISICTGSFILAKAGLLDHKRATTHWSSVDKLAKAGNCIQVEEDALYVTDDNVITSAGVTAGMDLALALVEQDTSKELAMWIAKQLVVFYHRPGGQKQFSEHLQSQTVENDKFREICQLILEKPGNLLSVQSLADRVNMSERNFSRQFQKHLGCSPGKYVEKSRLAHAKRLLEMDCWSLEQVAAKSGFNSVEVMRRAFQRCLGISPGDYRERFSK